MAEKKTVTITSKKKDPKTGQYEYTDTEYTPVSVRLDAFNNEDKYKDWTFTEQIESISDTGVLVNVTIVDPIGKIVRNAHAYERWDSSYINQTSGVENAGTSALGRALRYAGIGGVGPIAGAEELTVAIDQQKAIEAKLATEKQAGIDGAVEQAKVKVEEKKSAASVQPESNPDALTQGPRATMNQYYMALVNEKKLTFKDVMKRILALKKRVDGGEVVDNIPSVPITFVDFSSYYRDVPIPIARLIFDDMLKEFGLSDKYTKTPIAELLAQK